GYTAGHDGRGFGGFPDQLCDIGLFDAVVHVLAKLERSFFALFHGICPDSEHWPRVVDRFSQRTIPRLSLCHSLFAAVWLVCVPGGIFELHSTWGVAMAI